MAGSLTDASYGIVPLRHERGTWQALLIQSRRGSHWGFPKGHKEGSETDRMAAERELFEETHLTVSRYLTAESFHEFYTFQRQGEPVDKRVTYFVAEVEGDLYTQQEEVSLAKWFDVGDALNQLTYPESRQVLTHVMELLT